MTTWWSGTRVGEDAYGNHYYQSRDGKRRWVLYAGTVEASRVPSQWHGWLHHTFDEVPEAGGTLARNAWETEHVPNLTGTHGAYHPPGSVLSAADRPKVRGDYEAWQPE